MSSQYKYENHVEDARHQSKVKLTDLLSRINEEKSWKKQNLALSVAAVSAVTVFGIILIYKSNNYIFIITTKLMI